jgi:hypothetical protein
MSSFPVTAATIPATHPIATATPPQNGIPDTPTPASTVPPGALGQSYKLAATPQVPALVRSWSGQLAPRIPAALQQPPQPVAAGLVRLLPALFGPSARVLSVPGVPPVSSSAADSQTLQQTARAALTEPRLRAIESLQTDGQRVLARSLIATSISAYSAGVLTEEQLGQAIDLSLQEAQGYRSPVQTPPLTQPPPQGASPPEVQPTPDLQLPAVPAAENAQPAPQTPQARLDSMRRDFTSFQRALQADSLEGEGGARQLLVRLFRASASLGQDAPGPLAEQAREIEQSADILFRIENAARREIRGEASTSAINSARSERSADPASASVTEQRLGSVRELMAQYRVPDAFRNPAWEARVLEDALMFYNVDRARLLDGFPVQTSDMQDGSISPAQQMDIFSSPQKYLDYLKRSPAGWQQVSEQRLNKAVIFDRLQGEANNGGVLLPAQMREIERETDGWRRLYLYREAAKGIERLESDYTKLFLGRQPALQTERPRYTGLVEYYLGGTSGDGVFPGGNVDSPSTAGFGQLLGNNSVAPRMPRDVRLQARTLDFIGTVERDLAGSSGTATVTRAIETVDARIAALSEQRNAPSTSVQDRVYLDQALRVLGNFRTVVERQGQ